MEACEADIVRFVTFVVYLDLVSADGVAVYFVAQLGRQMEEWRLLSIQKCATYRTSRVQKSPSGAAYIESSCLTVAKLTSASFASVMVASIQRYAFLSLRDVVDNRTRGFATLWRLVRQMYSNKSGMLGRVVIEFRWLFFK